MRRALAIAAVVVAAWGVWLLVRSSGARDGRAGAPAVEETQLESGGATPILIPAEIVEPVAEAGARTERAAVESSTAPAHTRTSVDAPAQLHVLVVDAETRQPVPGLELIALLGDNFELESKLQRSSYGPGRIRFESVPVGLPRLLSIRSAVDGGELAYAVLEAFEPGERREITLEVTPRKLPIAWFRCVEDASGLPLAGVRVWSYSAEDAPSRGAASRSGQPVAVSDTAGLVRVGPAVAGVGLVLEADGFGPGWTNIHAGGALRAEATEIRFTATARLDIVLRTTDGTPVVGREVVVSADGSQLGTSFIPGGGYEPGGAGLERTQLTGPDGRAIFANLPTRWVVVAGIPVQYDIALRPERGGPSSVPLSRESVTLEPGARRELEFIVGDETWVAGHVVDQFGEPVVDALVGLSRTRAGAERSTGFTYRTQMRSTRTDSAGHFEFGATPIGHWQLWFPSAVRFTRAWQDSAAVTAGLLFELDGTASELELLLPAWRGLAITGRVIQEDGRPVEGVMVEARARASSHFSATIADSEGRFRIKPLLDAAYLISCSGYVDSTHPRHPGGIARSLVARPGDDVTLTLSPTATIRGRLVDVGSSDPGHVSIHWYRTRSGSAPNHTGSGSAAAPEFEFELEGLLPGVYTLIAHTEDSRSALATGIEVPARGEVEGVALRLEPWGRLLVTSRAQPDALHELVLLRAGAPVDWGNVAGGEKHDFVGPPGTYSLEARSADAAPELIQVEIVAGERAEIEVGSR